MPSTPPPRAPHASELESLEPRLLLSAGPADWFEQWPDIDAFSPDSIIDMRYLLDDVAGEHGYLQADENGDFVFQDGTPVKFWGANFSWTTNPQLQAKFYAKHGINFVRFGGEGSLGLLQTDPETQERYLDPAALADFDAAWSAFRNEGIYALFTPFWGHVITPDDGYDADLYAELPDKGAGKDTYGFACFSPGLQDAEWEWVEAFLNHVNPHTGLAYKDDPALAIMEIRNEESIFFHSRLNELANDTYPLHADLIQEGWQEWLLDKYGDDTALAAAWGAGMLPGDSVYNTNMTIYGAWQLTATGVPARPDETARAGDFTQYLAELQSEGYLLFKQRLDAIGYEGLVTSTAWKSGGQGADAADLWTEDALDVTQRHTYYGGGAGGHGISTGYVNNDSHMDAPGSGMLAESAWQVEDKPHMVTEWTQKPPNQWKFEAAPMMAFYGFGLQGWDASLHNGGARNYMGLGWPSNRSYVTETPHYLGQFPALSFAIYNGHFDEGDATALRRIELDEIFQGIDALTQPYSGSGFPGSSTYYVPAQALAIGRVSNKFEENAEEAYAQDWGLYWNQSSQVIESNTGQLTWDYGDEVILAHSEKTQAIVGFAQDGTYDLGGVVVSDIDTEAMSLIFTPLDDLPLLESQHILVTALAQDRQQGATYNEDGTELLTIGHSPLELEPVQATISLRGGPISSVKVVDMYGVPTSTSVTRNGNQFRIDGTYETYYYEIKRSTLTPPTAEVPPAAGPAFDATDYAFEVLYTDDGAVDVSLLDSSDLQITGPNGYSEIATFVSVDVPADGSPRVATYSIPAPGGTWGETDLGTYLVTMRSTQVADTGGQYTPYGTIGFFEFIDAPTAELTVSAPSVGSLRAYFDVTYTDDDGVDVSTIDGYDVRVTGPNGYDEPAVKHMIDNNTDGSPRTATYYVLAPGGTWNSPDDGVYTIHLQGDQVGDVSLNFCPAQTLGSFTFDGTAPQVIDVLLNGGESNPSQLDSLGFVFDEDVSASIDDGDLVLYHEQSGQYLDLSAATVSYDGPSDTATWDLTGVTVPTGSYWANLDDQDIWDAAGNLLDGDGNGTPGGAYWTNFEIGGGIVGDFDGDGALDVDDLNDLFAAINAGTHDPAYDVTGDLQVTSADADEWIRVLYGTEYGDATLDWNVDAADLSLLAANWQGTGKQWQEANFTGDPAGDVDAADLSLLAAYWQWTPPAAAPAGTSYARTTLPVGGTTLPEADLTPAAPAAAIPALKADPVVVDTPTPTVATVTAAAIPAPSDADLLERDFAAAAAEADPILTDALQPIELSVL